MLIMFLFPESPEFWINKNKENVSSIHRVNVLKLVELEPQFINRLHFSAQENHEDFTKGVSRR